MAIRRKKRKKVLTSQQKASRRAKQLRDLRFRANVAELKARIMKAGGQ